MIRLIRRRISTRVVTSRALEVEAKPAMGVRESLLLIKAPKESTSSSLSARFICGEFLTRTLTKARARLKPESYCS